MNFALAKEVMEQDSRCILNFDTQFSQIFFVQIDIVELFIVSGQQKLAKFSRQKLGYDAEKFKAARKI